MSKIIPLLLVGIVLSACAGAPRNEPLSESSEIPTRTPLPEEPQNTPQSPPETTVCSSPENWMIQYHRSGGFAGVDQSITLDSEGSLRIQSDHPPINDEKTISEDQVEAITDLLVQACPFETTSKKDNCADCYVYDLTIQMDDRTYSIQASDVTLPDDLQPLVGALSQLIQESEQ